MKANKLKVSKRTSSYVHKNLAEFEELVLLGYTNENFNNISYCLGKIQNHLFLEEVKTLEEFWRDSYTDSCDPEEVAQVVSDLRSRF